MNPLVLYVAVLHQQDLLAEASLRGRAGRAGRPAAAVPAWRRGLGRALASAARSVDPTVEARTPRTGVADRIGSALAG